MKSVSKSLSVLCIMSAGLLFYAPTVHATTYAAWNPSDKSSTVTLSNNNLTATNSDQTLNWTGVRGDIGVSSGKWYWETTIDSADVHNYMLVGVANTSAVLSAGGDSNTFSYNSVTGKTYGPTTGTAYGASYAAGDIIGVALDMDAGTLSFYKNNVYQGPAYTGLTGTLYPFQGLASDTLGAGFSQVTANFGSTSLTYSPPSGYNAGLFTPAPPPPPPPVPTITGAGVVNWLAKFTTSTTTIGNALLSDDGVDTTLTSGNFFLQIGSLIDSVTSGILNFGTTNATTMIFGRTGQNIIINSSVGIGTSSPTVALHVGGDIIANYITVLGKITFGSIGTASNCNSTASPAVCASAAAGSVAMPSGTDTLVVNTSAITANSQIFITEDSSLGSRLGITCNTTVSRTYAVSARTSGTSFTIKSSNNPVTNKACLSYMIVN